MILECRNCNLHFESKKVGGYSTGFSHTGDPIDDVNYLLFKCPKCFKPILTEQLSQFDPFKVELFFGTPRVLFPSSEFHLNPIIPEKLRDSLKESIKCFKANSYTATAIMCRRTIEGFCQLKGVKESNLAKSIEKLKINEIINDQLFEWANELRLVGNEAAHNIDVEFSVIHSRDILDFTIAILDFTYSFKDKFDRFKERQNNFKRS